MLVVSRRIERPPDPYLDDLGPALRRLRKRASRTLREVAARAELSTNEVSEYERGARRPGLDNLVRYLRGVGADLRMLQDVLDEVSRPFAPAAEDPPAEELRSLQERMNVELSDEALEQRVHSILRRMRGSEPSETAPVSAAGYADQAEAKLTVHEPARQILRRLLTVELDPEVVEDLHRHIERGCVTCLLTMRELTAHTGPEPVGEFLRSTTPSQPEEDGGAGQVRPGRQTLFRVLVLDNERRLAPGLLAELERRPPAHRREAVRTSPRYQLYGFAVYLAEESRRAGFRDVERAQGLAELGVEVADVLDPAIYLPAVVHDCQALTRAFLGNARRVASDLVGAGRAFDEALVRLEQGSGSQRVRAEFLSLLGSLRTDQARYPEARRVLEEALELLRPVGQRQDEGRLLLKLSTVHGYSGEPERAVRAVLEAAPLLEEGGDDRLLVLARHNLSYWLVDARDPLEALAVFQKAQHLYDRLQDDPWLQLRRTWQEGRIHAALGDAARAEPLLEEARQTATERELPYELAMINLELALFHLGQGDAAKVRQLAEEMVPIFRSRELHAHALAAIYLFQHAARTQTATTTLAKDILLYLRQAQNNPSLPFGE